MGLTHLKIEVANPADMNTWQTVECLIDSGAIYSVIPAGTLQALGIQPIDEQEFRLANGESIRRKKGIAAFRYEQRVGGADVIFGEPGDMNLLGAFTLEALGLSLDPLKRELRPLPMILAGIGPVTARAAEELGLRVDVVASEYTVEGLVRAIKEMYED